MPEPKKSDETMRRLVAAAEVAKKHMAPKPKEVSDEELARRESRAVLRYWKDQDEAIRESEFDADEPMSDFDMAFWDGKTKGQKRFEERMEDADARYRKVRGKGYGE